MTSTSPSNPFDVAPILPASGGSSGNDLLRARANIIANNKNRQAGQPPAATTKSAFDTASFLAAANVTASCSPLDAAPILCSSGGGSASDLLRASVAKAKAAARRESRRPPLRSSLSPVRNRSSSRIKKNSSFTGLKDALNGTGITEGGMRKNRISFGTNQTLVFEKEIEPDDDDAKNAVWYSKQEMKSIRKDLKKSIKLGDITRGLEQYSGEDKGQETKLKRLNHIRTILDLQRQQREGGITDETGLQMLSRSMSADNLRRAQQLASMDSCEAFQEHSSCTLNRPFIKAKNANEYTVGQANATFQKKAKGLRRSQKSTPNMFLQMMYSASA